MARFTRKAPLGVAALALLLAGGCGREAEPVPPPAAVITMDWPAGFGKPERIPVQFPHQQHQQALQAEGCQACHLYDEAGKFSPRLKKKFAGNEAGDYADSVHGFCLDCHQQRRAAGKKSGPGQQECGLCHREYQPGKWRRQPMFFDYSLHQRHIEASGNKCETCHHRYDEKEKKLYYRKNTETACFDCHGDHDQGKKPSWKNAAHTDCISCHLKKRQEGRQQAGAAGRQDQRLGPVDCLGCHDLDRRLAIKKLEKIPRLDRGQLDRIWVQTAGTKAKLVPFDHRRHETGSFFCTGCHHHALRSCQDCHDQAGNNPAGGGVSREQAFHDPHSQHSCVGCHLAQTDRPACAGCHALLPRRASDSSCRLCHRGPEPEKLAEQSVLVSPLARAEAPAGTAAEPVPVPRPELFAEVPAPPLPQPTKTAFPRELVLDSGGKKYQPTKFPHLKIVQKLYAPVAESPLAIFFQPRVEIFCAGCHHHQPLGTRPTACVSCHPARPDPRKDRPGLREAYHRQCLGCHRAMKLKQQGCTDCHQEEEKKNEEAGQ